jgi:hypothetical protein
MTASVLSGPAFSKPFKGLAIALCGGLIIWSVTLPFDFFSKSGLWILAVHAMILYTVWHIQTSVTTLDETQIKQTWIWDKSMQISDMAFVKIIHVPALAWLIAPRIYARTMMGKFAVFYTSSPEMLQAMAALEIKLKANRSNF